MKIIAGKIQTPYLLLTFCLLVLLQTAYGQITADTTNKSHRLKVGVFVPLYLDSAFDLSGNYRYNKTIPPFIANGLDYYLGIQQALDSMANYKTPVDIHVFDSRALVTRPDTLTIGDTLKQMNLLTGIVNVNEAAVLARFAKNNEIPFVNINLPNEAGSTGNPFHIIINPTLATHCLAIYKYLQSNHALSHVILITKKGSQEDRVRTYLQDAGTSTASVPLKIKTLELKDSLLQEDLIPMLDSNKVTICIIGSLDLQFGMAVSTKLAPLTTTYPLLVCGMPTWEQFNFSKPTLKGLEMIYSTSFYTEAEEKNAKQLRQALFDRYFIRAKDITLRIYDIMNVLCRLSPGKGTSLLDQLSQTQVTHLGQLNIQPVRNKKTGLTDYSENKKIFFVKKLNGATQAIE